MFLSLLIDVALSAEGTPSTVSPSVPPIEWLKPLVPGTDPATVTLAVVMVDDNETEFTNALLKWQPDAVLLVHTNLASKRELVAAASMARGTDAAKVQVYIDLQGLGGDIDDPKIVPRGVNPDDQNKLLRVVEFVGTLAGSQQSIGFVSWGAISPAVSEKGKALIGADANLWLAALPSGMTGWSVSANDVEQPPAGCQVTFGRLLAKGYEEVYRTGQDLTLGTLVREAKKQTELVSACGYFPEWQATGSASFDDVLFKGTGITPTVTQPIASMVPSTVTPLPKVPHKRAVPRPVSLGTTGAGAALLGTAGVMTLMLNNDVEEAKARFDENNARTEFKSEEDALSAANVTVSGFESRARLISGLAIGGSALVLGGGITFVLSGDGGLIGYSHNF